MKRVSLVAAGAVIVAANAFALLHAWRNRSGPVESDITVTERELPESYSSSEEDSGVALNLQWTDPVWGLYPHEDFVPWLDEKILRELGFDTSIRPSDQSAYDFYQRQRARRAFVALEFDGPAWREWMDRIERRAQEQSAQPVYMKPASQRETSTRLVAVDAGRDAVKLRARHPDRGSVVIVPAVIRIAVQPKSVEVSGRLYGSIQEIPSSIHVPLPFSDGFRRLPRNRNDIKYRVHLRYGALLEPWIVGVEFSTSAVR